MHADNPAETLCVRLEIRVAQKEPDVGGGFHILHIQPNDAVGRMHERLTPEIPVVREEGWFRERVRIPRVCFYHLSEIEYNESGEFMDGFNK